ncbi:hypothetical protein DL89DRAFT_80548 [Linderina pennispora]|uniref:RRM domain-containing protein n=1 Tax=Linderina pennispora TaxID=61395 RepID=A0A1Y1WGF7_9FUNG|nr:uncharacterized protein DL89DRAFT_80548 [Linderina pennispora]ORX72631.1 hypothetical protein DL89DRAFT_80548 [Linderina pennispora]
MRFDSAKTLFIAGFTPDITHVALCTEFEKYGRIIRCEIPPLRGSESHPYAFIEYDTSTQAQEACAAIHGKTLGNSLVTVHFAQRQQPPYFRRHPHRSYQNCYDRASQRGRGQRYSGPARNTRRMIYHDEFPPYRHRDGYRGGRYPGRFHRGGRRGRGRMHPTSDADVRTQYNNGLGDMDGDIEEGQFDHDPSFQGEEHHVRRIRHQESSQRPAHSVKNRGSLKPNSRNSRRPSEPALQQSVVYDDELESNSGGDYWLEDEDSYNEDVHGSERPSRYPTRHVIDPHSGSRSPSPIPPKEGMGSSSNARVRNRRSNSTTRRPGSGCRPSPSRYISDNDDATILTPGQSTRTTASDDATSE